MAHEELQTPLEEVAENTHNKSSKKRLVRLGLIAALVVGGIVFIRAFAPSSPATINTKYVNKPSPNEAKSVGLNPSPAYGDKLAIYAERKAAYAKEQGETFVAPVSAPPKPPIKEAVQPVKKAKPKPQKPSKPSNTSPSKRAQHMEQVLLSLTQTSYTPQQTLSGFVGVQTPSSLPKEAPKQTASPLPSLKAGDILYGINRIAITSDAPGPALVEIIDGEFAGAKVMGGFAHTQESLTITFSTLITKGGVRIPIKAYAIDPNTETTALASHVDRHLLERYGSLFAASFLEGFGNAVKNQGQEYYATVHGSGYRLPAYNPTEQTIIALGKVGERAANSLQGQMNRKPTVTLKSGIDIAVLICEVLR